MLNFSTELRLFVLLMFISVIANGQISPARVLRIQNSTTPFSSNLPAGTLILDISTAKLYQILKPVKDSNSISSLEIGTDYKESISDEPFDATSWDNNLDAPTKNVIRDELVRLEEAANKSAEADLGTSDILYPTQNAVKTYVDTKTAEVTPDKIQDADQDTKIQVEKLANDDEIHFDIAGTEKWVMRGSRLEALNNGQSVFIGEGAGVNATGEANTFIGYQSGLSNTSGEVNTAVGGSSLFSNLTGTDNTAVGYSTLYTNITGYGNTALGSIALFSNNGGLYNTALGTSSLYANTSGNGNSAVGYNSNYFNEQGNNNVTIGFEAGKGISKHNKSGNIFIGYQAGYNEIGNNKLYIENSNSATPLIYGDFDSNLARINGDLDVTGVFSIRAGSPGLGKVLTSDAAGNASWQTVSGSGTDDQTAVEVTYSNSASGLSATNVQAAIDELEGNMSASSPFSTASNVTSNAPGTIASDDFVFGSSSLDDMAGTDDDRRILFDKSKSAFRAGIAESTQWDDANRGDNSVGFGYGTVASGNNASAFGEGSIASGTNSVAFGEYTNSSGDFSSTFGSGTKASGLSATAFGSFTNATATNSTAFGLYSTASGIHATAFGENTKADAMHSFAIGRFNIGGGDPSDFAATDPMFEIGNGTDDLNRSNALIVRKNGNMELSGSLKIGAYTLPNIDGASGQVLATDGSGIMSWTSAPSSTLWSRNSSTSILSPVTPGDHLKIGGQLAINGAEHDNLSGINLNVTEESVGIHTVTNQTNGTTYAMLNSLTNSIEDRVIGIRNDFSMPDNSSFVSYYSTGTVGYGSIMQNEMTFLGDGIGLMNDITGNKNIDGVRNVLRPTLSATGVYNSIYAKDDGSLQTLFGIKNELRTYSGDIGYGSYYKTFGTGTNYSIFVTDDGGDTYFGDQVQLKKQLLDADGDVGTSGQVLSSTGTATNWIDAGSGSGTDDQTAAEVDYSNATSGLSAATVQEAIDELEGNMTVFHQIPTGWTVSGNNVYSSVSGNVGIGNSSPTERLSVGSPTLGIQRIDINSQTQSHLQFSQAGTPKWGIMTNDAGAGTLGFYDYDVTGGNGYRMVIDNSGNVGLGTATPGQKLDIDGQIRIRGGNPGAGKALTSDADGNATWATLSANTISGNNGLTNNSGTIELGGDLTQYTNINLNGNGFLIGTIGANQGPYLDFGETEMFLGNYKSDYSAGIAFEEASGISFYYQQDIPTKSYMVRLGDDVLSYVLDYSADFVDRSLVDKAYVDSKLSVSSFDKIQDANQDTKIQVEKLANDDEIHFDIAGTEKWRMRGSLLEALETNESLFIGEGAGATGLANTHIGYHAGYSSTSGEDNTALGTSALYMNSNGSDNTAIGYSTLYKNTSGSSNTAFGSVALFNNTGSRNSAMGTSSLYQNTTGSYNTTNGSDALRSNTIGNNNTAIGYGSNYYNSQGNNNVTLGFEAGRGTSVHNKSGNIFIGYQAGYNETGSDKLYIENSNSATPLIYGDFASNLARINGNLDVTGIFSMRGGSPGAGKVLTSDASGNASWETPAGGSVSFSDTPFDATSWDNNLEGATKNALRDELVLRENLTNKSPITTLGTSDDLYPTQNAVKTYVDNKVTASFNPGQGLSVSDGKLNLGGTIDNAVSYVELQNTAAIQVGGIADNQYGLDIRKSPGFVLTSLLGSQVDGSDGYSSLTMLGTGIALQAADNGEPDEYSMVSFTKRGLSYSYGKPLYNMAAENATNDRWIPDKAYVDSKITSLSMIADDNKDTKIQVEESPDENVIRFDLIGVERWKMVGSRLESFNTTQSLLIGEGAGGNSTGVANTYLGYHSGFSNTSGENNTALGASALFKNISGIDNTAIGFSSLYENTIGSSNTAIGSEALNSNNNGSGNSALGNFTLQSNTAGTANSAFGANALTYNTTGNCNIAIGYGSNYYNEQGNNNVTLGFEAGMGTALHNKSGNVFIGYRAGYNETGSNKLYIENSNSTTPLIYGDFDTNLARINGNLDVTGVFSMRGGSPGAGKVLTSDATGNASWEAPTGGSVSFSDTPFDATSWDGNLDAATKNALRDELVLKENTANKSIDGTFTANSDIKFPSEKAVKTYVDNAVTASFNPGQGLSVSDGKLNLGGTIDNITSYIELRNAAQVHIGGFVDNDYGLWVRKTPAYVQTTINGSQVDGSSGYSTVAADGNFINIEAGDSDSFGDFSSVVFTKRGFSYSTNVTYDMALANADNQNWIPNKAYVDNAIAASGSSALWTGVPASLTLSPATPYQHLKLGGKLALNGAIIDTDYAINLKADTNKKGIHTTLSHTTGYANIMLNELTSTIDLESSEIGGILNTFSSLNNTKFYSFKTNGTVGQGAAIYNQLDFLGPNYGNGMYNVLTGTGTINGVYNNIRGKQRSNGVLNILSTQSDGSFQEAYGTSSQITTYLNDDGYGLYVEVEGAGNNYGVYVRSGLSYFGDKVRLKSYLFDESNDAGLAGQVLSSTGYSTNWISLPAPSWYMNGVNMYSAVSGNVGIGDSTPDAKLDVEGNAIITGAYSNSLYNDHRLLYVDSQGNLGQLTSSEKVKKEIVGMEDISWLYNLRPVNFRYKYDETNNPLTVQFGLIAEEVSKVKPQFVMYDDKGSEVGVHYDRFISVLIKTAQDHRKQLAEQEARINAQDQKIEELKSQIDLILKTLNNTSN